MVTSKQQSIAKDLFSFKTLTRNEVQTQNFTGSSFSFDTAHNPSSNSYKAASISSHESNFSKPSDPFADIFSKFDKLNELNKLFGLGQTEPTENSINVPPVFVTPVDFNSTALTESFQPKSFKPFEEYRPFQPTLTSSFDLRY